MSKYIPWKSFEQEITRKLKGLGFNAKRNWSNQFIKKDGADVIAVKEGMSMVLQLKYGKEPSLRAAFNEALQARETNKQMPIGVCRYSEEKDTLVVMTFSFFQKLLEDYGLSKKGEK